MCGLLPRLWRNLSSSNPVTHLHAPTPVAADKERALIYESLFRDIATIVAEKCVNPETLRPYTLSLVEKALRDSHFSVNPAKTAKQQALKAVAVLKELLPIERARMRVRVTLPAAGA